MSEVESAKKISDTGGSLSDLKVSQDVEASSPAVVEINLSGIDGPDLDRSKEKGIEAGEEKSKDFTIQADVLREVSSLDELKNIYKKQGMEFDSLEGLIGQVEKDWRIQTLKWIEEGSENKTRVKPLVEKINIDGKDSFILGVVHSHLMGLEYIEDLAKEFHQRPFWLSEHKLRSEFFPAAMTEIADHTVDGVLKRWADSEKRMFLTPFKSAKWHIRRALFRSKGVKLPSYKDSVYSLGHMPPDACNSLPVNIDILQREELGLPFTQVQRRSAFQAAFLKAWQPQNWEGVAESKAKTEEKLQGRWDEKGIMVGAAHLPEIIFFLKHGISDKKVESRAIRQAEILNKSPEGYDKFFRRQEIVFQALCASTALGAGLLGAQILMGTAQAVGHLTKLLSQ